MYHGLKVYGGFAENCASGAYGTGQRLVSPGGRTTMLGEQTFGCPASQKIDNGARSLKLVTT